VTARLVFVHGAGADGRVWQVQRLDFPDAVALDLPGHPEGEPLPTVDAYAEWVVGRFVERGWIGAVLVGHSMGGAVALGTALRAPELVGGLVLVASGPRLRVHPRFLEGLVERPDATLDRFVDLWFGPQADTRTRERVREAVRRLGPHVLLQDLKACDAFDVTAQLGRVQSPTLVVAGEKDVLTPPDLSRELHAGIRGASLFVLPDAGHMLFLERRRMFRDSVRTFLAGLPPRR